MTELTLHTGGIGEFNKIYLKWQNKAGEERIDVLEINIKNQDFPRKMEFILNGVKIAQINADSEFRYLKDLE